MLSWSALEAQRALPQCDGTHGGPRSAHQHLLCRALFATDIETPFSARTGCQSVQLTSLAPVGARAWPQVEEVAAAAHRFQDKSIGWLFVTIFVAPVRDMYHFVAFKIVLL
jgi:hypothetical protein